MQIWSFRRHCLVPSLRYTLGRYILLMLNKDQVVKFRNIFAINIGNMTRTMFNNIISVVVGLIYFAL